MYVQSIALPVIDTVVKGFPVFLTNAKTILYSAVISGNSITRFL